MRILKAATAAALAFSMSATPVLAQSASPLSLAATAGLMQDEDSGGSNRGSQILPALVIFGLLAAAILYSTNRDNDQDNPTSP